MKVPYVDLVARHRAMRERLLEAFGRVLDHGQFILGPEVEELEQRLARFLGLQHVVSCASGTDALQLALRLHGIGRGDEVITVSHSFVGTAAAVKLVGATPVFVDVDERTMTMDVGLVEEAVGTRTRAVILVHLNGYPCETEELARVCEKHGLVLIEDCAQALGARRHGRSVGSSGMGCFSLHPIKPLSGCGDGGFLTVHGLKEANALRRLRNLGLADRDHCSDVGSNSRLDTLQAAALLVKLEHAESWIEARRAHAAEYRTALRGHVTLPPEDANCEQTYSAFVVRHGRRDELQSRLAQRGIDAKVHYPVAIHQQPPFASDPPASLPVTENVVREILSLPVGPELSIPQRNMVIRTLKEALGATG